jgi:hypothetical protein
MWTQIYLLYVPKPQTPRYYPIGKVVNYQAIHRQARPGRPRAPLGLAGRPACWEHWAQVSARLRELRGQERQRMVNRQAAVVQAATENGSQDLSMVSPWMGRTRWVEAYQGARRDLLAAMTEIPSNRSQRYGLSFGHHEGLELCSLAATERRLGQVMQAVDQLFDRCEETVRHTCQPILTWLQSQHPTVVARRPFRLVG